MSLFISLNIHVSSSFFAFETSPSLSPTLGLFYFAPVSLEAFSMWLFCQHNSMSYIRLQNLSLHEDVLLN